MRKLLKGFVVLIVSLLGFIAASNLYINFFAAKYLFSKIETVPENDYGLILGTSKYLKGGGVNTYYTGRIKSTASLFNNKQIKKIIVSGYIGHNYNEPKAMKKDLNKLGIPNSAIILDTIGDRTFMSVRHLLKIPTTDSITIISQKFHNQRAIFIAHNIGVEAIGYNVPNNTSKVNIKTSLREFMAKALALCEIILNRFR